MLQNGHTEIVKSLLKAGAYTNQKSEIGCIPLTVASGNGHLAIVETLLKYEAEVNHVASDPQKSTPLGEAVENTHKQVAKTLIQVHFSQELIIKSNSDIILSLHGTNSH